ncbi:MAG TPA: signal recognition particle protein [Candidatus Nitrosotalea sp.]|nr:signal recognition particle protein [Candidatus Nitrosotalea sp.]
MFDNLSQRLTLVMRRMTGGGVLKPEEVVVALREVRLALLEADVNYRVVKDFVGRVQERAVGSEVSASLGPAQQVVKIVHEELEALLGGNDEGLVYAPGGVSVIMLCGLQGSGKTTSAAKLGLLARREGHRPLLVGLDLSRPAAVEQLAILAREQKIDFHSGSGSAREVAREALARARQGSHDVVILDTAGRLHADQELLLELAGVAQEVSPTQSLLVVDAMTGQEAVRVAEAFGTAVKLDGVVLTKLDGDPRGGAALSLRSAAGLSIRFAGVGERAADLEVFRAARMASRILGMGDVLSLIEKAERGMDREQAERVERNLRAGHLSFDDFLAQLRQIRSLGSVSGVLDLLPGGARLKAATEGEDTEAEMRRMEAIILSMTPRERARPELIDGSRRRRIAAGSGVQVSEVNRLLRAREQMQLMAKQLGLGPGKGRRGSPALPGGGFGRLFGR